MINQAATSPPRSSVPSTTPLQHPILTELESSQYTDPNNNLPYTSGNIPAKNFPQDPSGTLGTRNAPQMDIRILMISPLYKIGHTRNTVTPHVEPGPDRTLNFVLAFSIQVF